MDTSTANKSYMFETMVPLITLKNEVLGAIIYEKSNNNDVKLNWYESAIRVEEDVGITN